jgi:hypothetical protein
LSCHREIGHRDWHCESHRDRCRGFVIGGYIDATGASAIPGMSELLNWPRPLRIVIELVVGFPIVFGIALYGILETADSLWFLSTPFRKLFGGCAPQIGIGKPTGHEDYAD